MRNKETYKIWNYFKDNLGQFTVFGSVIVFIFSALIKYLYYVMNSSILTRWKIDSAYMPEIHYNQIYLIACVVIFLLVNYVVGYLKKSIIDRFLYNSTIMQITRYRINLIKSRIPGSMENDLDEIRTLLKESVKTEIEIVLKMIVSFVLANLTYFLCIIILLIPSNIIVEKLLVESTYITVINVFFDLISILIMSIINRKDCNTSIRNNADNPKKIIELSDSKEIEFEVNNSDKWKKFFSDKEIMLNIGKFLGCYVLLLLIIPINIRSHSFNTFDIAIVDNKTYSVIFVGDEKVILKECILKNTSIVIDDNSFVIEDKSGLLYETKSFDLVEMANVE